MNKYEEYINQIEECFANNQVDKAHKILVDGLNEARITRDFVFELQMLNELIGFYRQISDKENLLSCITEAVKLCENEEIRNIRDYRIGIATTYLNAATGFRSIGELNTAKEYYDKVLFIYNDELDSNDMLFAGLYNNISLLFEETKEYDAAADYLNKALNIALYNNEQFEIAVTYANLSNVYIKLNKLELAKEYAYEAISRFENRNVYDPHYCAAISALGMCHYYEGDKKKAYSLFQKGMDIIERSVGKNSQYIRLKENRDMCIDTIKGLELSKLYYEQIGKPMLEEKFSDYIDELAIGLVGEGSDCFGFDDDYSIDHDFGPDFCIWITDELYEKIGKELENAYNDLPIEFMGVMRTKSSHGIGRRGVQTISSFYKRILGYSIYSDIDFRTVPDYSLATATNGEVFTDKKGIFSDFRNNLLKGYPEDILYLKLAEDVAKISQTGQYNYTRMLDRKDRLSADLILNDCIKQIMLLMYHIANMYPVHDKWLYRGVKELEECDYIIDCINDLHKSFKLSDDEARELVLGTMNKIGEHLAYCLYKKNYISDVSPYLDEHTDELLKKSYYASLSNKELVDTIAKKEFEAFDKVKNEGGRASCQNDWPTFSVMRKSQYLTWDRDMLIQYIYDFVREYELGHNLITEKYGRMMESTAPKAYEKIAHNFEPLSDEKKTIIEQIVDIQMNMLHEFSEEYPGLAGNARSFHTYEDNIVNTSYETYLRGEISTYSDKMLQLYAQYVINSAINGINIAKITIENTAKLYGYDDLNSFEKSI